MGRDNQMNSNLQKCSSASKDVKLVSLKKFNGNKTKKRPNNVLGYIYNIFYNPIITPGYNHNSSIKPSKPLITWVIIAHTVENSHKRPKLVPAAWHGSFYRAKILYRSALLRESIYIAVRIRSSNNEFKYKVRKGRWGLREVQIPQEADEIRMFDTV